MARLTSELVVRLFDQVTKPAQAVARAIKGIGDARDRAEKRMDDIRGRMVDAVGAGYVLTNALKAPISAAVDFESKMADVRKVVDFPTPASFKAMGDDIRAMSLEMPMAASGIADIVAAAGQSGLAQNELLDFAKMAAQVGVAWDVSGAEAGDALAKLKTAIGLSVKDTGLLADAINHLGNKSAASAPDILNMVRRVAGSAKTFGLSAEQAAAFGSAMIGAGFEAEVAATSFLNMGRALTKGESATKRQNGAFAQLGLDAGKVAKRMQKDAVGTISDVLARLRRLPEHMLAPVMSDLFGDEARALTPLITTQGLLEKSLGYVADEATYAGSAFEEYKVRSQTTANAMQLFQNRLNNLGITIGSALIPALNDIMAGLSPVIDGVTRFAEANPVLTRNVIAATSAVVGFRIAVVGLQWALGMSNLSLLTAGASVVSFGSKIGTAAKAVAAFTFAPFLAGAAAARRAMVGFAASAAILGPGGALRIAVSGLGPAMLGLLSPIRLVAAAMGVLKMAVIGTGIGAVLVGIALAGAWIYNNWKGISTAFEAFKGAFSRAIEPIRPALEPVVGLFTAIGDAIGTLTGRVDPLGGKWAALGISIGKGLGEGLVAVVQKGGEIVAFIQGLPAKLAAVPWGNVAAGLIAEFVAIPFRLASIPLEILGIFTGIDLGGAAAAMIATFVAGVKQGILNLAGWVKQKLKDMFTVNVSLPFGLGGGGGKPSAPAAPIYEPAPDMMRAKGGPVRAGETYVVGDGGEPEFYTPHADGFVTPMSKAADLERRAMANAGRRGSAGSSGGRSAGAGGGSFTYAPSYTIPATGMDAAALRALLEEHDRDAMRRFESMQDGAFADS